MANSLMVAEAQKDFFKAVPINQIVQQTAEALELAGAHDTVTFPALCRAFKMVNTWCIENLVAGDFTYAIRCCVDQIHEEFSWEYIICGVNVPIRFLVHQVKLDARRNFTEGELTVERCLQGVRLHLEKADDKITQFNALVRQIKPVLPTVDVDKAMKKVMEAGMLVMADFYKNKYQTTPTMKLLKFANYDGQVLGETLKVADYCLMTPDCRMIFDIFQMDHIGWVRIRLLYELKGLGIKFVILESDIGSDSNITGENVSETISAMLTKAAAGIRNWNWLVEGGHNKKSEVKNRWG